MLLLFSNSILLRGRQLHRNSSICLLFQGSVDYNLTVDMDYGPLQGDTSYCLF
jgi:hypothetical protein